MIRLSVGYLLRLYFFWLILFAVNRFIFLLVQYEELHDLPFWKIVASFFYALKIDSSTAFYSLAIPFVILWFMWWFRKNFLLKVLNLVVVVFIVLHSMIAFGDSALYTQWHTKLNWEALSHFAHPSEVFKSATGGLTFLFFGTTFLLSAIYIYIYFKKVRIKFLPRKRLIHKWQGLAFWLVLGFGIFTGIRGGWMRFPINLSVAYYAEEAVLNDAAVNSTRYLVDNVRRQFKQRNPYSWMSDEEAAEVVESLFAGNKTLDFSVLTNTRPNILFFILESWPADAVREDLPGPITPFFDSLIKDGVYFNDCYSSGFISKQGLPGILSAFPASGQVSIIDKPERSMHLPAINEDLEAAGYHTGFIYGGKLDFGNIQSYIYSKQFDLVTTERDFSSDLPSGALGIPDKYMVDPLIEYLDKEQTPFFYCWYTLSTHPPYDIPEKTDIGYKGIQRKFVNTLRYADEALEDFFAKAVDKPWYDNTLFVFVSDHSFDSHVKRTVEHKDRNKIPLLFYGNVLKDEWKGREINRTVSQLDIAATLLHELDLPSDKYPWSRNLFDDDNLPFAAYNFLSGSGFVAGDDFVAQDDLFPKFLLTNLKDSLKIKELIHYNRAVEQTAYNYFLEFGKYQTTSNQHTATND